MKKIFQEFISFLKIQVIGIFIGFFFSIITNNIQYLFGYIVVSVVMSNCIGYMNYLFFSLFEKYLKEKMKSRVYYVLPGILATSLGFELGAFLNWKIFNVKIYNPGMHGIILVIYAIIGAIISLSLYSYYRLEYRLANKIKENEKLKRLKIQAKLDELQSKLNPHFLFNTFNSIVELVHDQPEKVEKMILNLSDIYRKILSLNENNLININEEIDLIKKYLTIEKFRMNERLTYSIDLDTNCNEVKIPPFCIEVLVENAVIHGISKKREGGNVKISIRKNENSCIIEIEDDGKGFKKIDSEGFGLYSVEERLKLIYNNNYKFNILKNNPGTKVIMEVPINEDSISR